MLKSLILDGKIPYAPTVKKVAFWIAWLSPLLIFAIPDQFRDFGSIGLWVLVFVLSMGQLAFILPSIRLFGSLMLFRGELGVFSGMMVLAHFAGYLLFNGINIVDVIDGKFYWDWQGFYFWGILGMLAMLPVLLTSNKFSRKKLGAGWKKVQKLSYLFLLFGAIHVVMIGEGAGIAAIIAVVTLRVLQKLKFQIKF